MIELLRHRYVLFTGARYLGFVLLFIRGLLIASVLGPTALGVWGFLSLIIEYLGYTNIGVQYAINVELSVRGRTDVAYARHVVNCAFGIILIVAVALQATALCLKYLQIDLFAQYHTLPFIVQITVIGSLMHSYYIFVNVFRAYDRLAEVVIAELSVTVATVVSAILLPSDILIEGLLWAMIGGYVISLAIFVIRSPLAFRPAFRLKAMWPIIAQGASLLVYNLSFYLMTMVARSVVGLFYRVEEMGFFTLANGLASAVMLGINSIFWIVYPRILYILRPGVPIQKTLAAMEEMTYILQKFVYAIVLAAAAVSPMVLILLPQYEPIFPTLYFLLLTQALLLGSGASNSLAVARHKEKAVARIGLFMVAVLIPILTVVVKLGVPVSAVSAVLMVTAGIYTLMMNQYAYKLLDVEQPLRRAFWLTFGVGDIVPALTTAIIALTPFMYVAGSAGLILYILMNATTFTKLLPRIHEISIQSDFVRSTE